MTTPTGPPPDIKDIQGDIILGLPKRHEDFVFFQITDVAKFKQGLQDLIPHITTTADVKDTRNKIYDHKRQGRAGLIPVSSINISFSFVGLTQLGITDHLGDADFEAGQFAHAQRLGDQGSGDGPSFDPDWLQAFKETNIHGLLLFAGDCKASVDGAVAIVERHLSNAIKEVLRVEGNVRVAPEKGHEHFGYLDGISSPCVPTVSDPLPGQQQIEAGVLVVGEKNDPNIAVRPAWAKNGSFLVYRHLQQFVPEFAKFVTDNPILLPGLDRKHGSELFGARLFGRWKSGAPIDVTPLQDDPALAADKTKNNNFDFSQPPPDQTRCPFAAHIRKTNPRSDLAQFAGAVATHSILRSGIPFGPEVTPEEARLSQTEHSRGLAFVCYQSAIANGFEFLQEAWANTVSFPPKKNPDGSPLTSGFDPIIGQKNGQAREVFGTNPSEQGQQVAIPRDFVKSDGGAYFFSPSITALKTKFSV